MKNTQMVVMIIALVTCALTAIQAPWQDTGHGGDSCEQDSFRDLTVEEAAQFVSEIQKFAIEDYPVENVQRLAKSEAKLAHDNDCEVIFTYTDKGAALMSSFWKDGKPHMIVHVNRLNWGRQLLRDNPTLLEDEIIAATLHETFHLFHQDIDWNLEAERDHGEVHDLESEAWHHVVANVYLPMLQGGRLQGGVKSQLPGTAMAVSTYVLTKGDPTDPRWHRFIDTVAHP